MHHGLIIIKKSICKLIISLPTLDWKESKIYLYQKMWLSMMLTGPSAFVDSNHDGLERVRKGDYAFLGESNFNEYIAKRECDLYQVGGLLNSIGYGVATPLKSPYK